MYGESVADLSELRSVASRASMPKQKAKLTKKRKRSSVPSFSPERNAQPIRVDTEEESLSAAGDINHVITQSPQRFRSHDDHVIEHLPPAFSESGSGTFGYSSTRRPSIFQTPRSQRTYTEQTVESHGEALPHAMQHVNEEACVPHDAASIEEEAGLFSEPEEYQSEGAVSWPVSPASQSDLEKENNIDAGSSQWDMSMDRAETMTGSWRSESETPSLTQSAPSTKRGRGRPRKYPPGMTAKMIKESKQKGPKRPRGRPPKRKTKMALARKAVEEAAAKDAEEAALRDPSVGASIVVPDYYLRPAFSSQDQQDQSSAMAPQKNEVSKSSPGLQDTETDEEVHDSPIHVQQDSIPSRSSSATSAASATEEEAPILPMKRKRQKSKETAVNQVQKAQRMSSDRRTSSRIQRRSISIDNEVQSSQKDVSTPSAAALAAAAAARSLQGFSEIRDDETTSRRLRVRRALPDSSTATARTKSGKAENKSKKHDSESSDVPHHSPPALVGFNAMNGHPPKTSVAPSAPIVPPHSFANIGDDNDEIGDVIVIRPLNRKLIRSDRQPKRTSRKSFSKAAKHSSRQSVHERGGNEQGSSSNVAVEKDNARPKVVGSSSAAAVRETRSRITGSLPSSKLDTLETEEQKLVHFFENKSAPIPSLVSSKAAIADVDGEFSRTAALYQAQLDEGEIDAEETEDDPDMADAEGDTDLDQQTADWTGHVDIAARYRSQRRSGQGKRRLSLTDPANRPTLADACAQDGAARFAVFADPSRREVVSNWTTEERRHLLALYSTRRTHFIQRGSGATSAIGGLFNPRAWAKALPGNDKTTAEVVSYYYLCKPSPRFREAKRMRKQLEEDLSEIKEVNGLVKQHIRGAESGELLMMEKRRGGLRRRHR